MSWAPPDVGEARLARREKVWNTVILNSNHGLTFWRDFARTHHKPFSIPEWGVDNRNDGHGGQDNPYFIEQMHRFITNPDNNVYFDCYFDVQAGDGHHQLSPGVKGAEVTQFPESAARFRALFGSTGPMPDHMGSLSSSFNKDPASIKQK